MTVPKLGEAHDKAIELSSRQLILAFTRCLPAHIICRCTTYPVERWGEMFHPPRQRGASNASVANILVQWRES
jgi:hypothetical protein